LRIDEKATKLIDFRNLADRGAKELEAISNAQNFVKQERRVKNLRDTYLVSSRTNYDLPPLMIWNQVELKLCLEDLCSFYNLSGDMEIDDGNSFSYSVIA
jgi:hypothetical protein